MPKSAHLIFYVKDQQLSTAFYQYVLDLEPALNVPGMTEFTLMPNCVLGLMPESSIKKLLGTRLPDPSEASGIPRAELYLCVDNADKYHQRAINMGATELSAVQVRDWGDIAGYCLDLDGHVLAFAQ